MSVLARLRLLSTLCLATAPLACQCGAEPVDVLEVKLRLAPDEVDFGPLPIGARVTRNVILANDGGAAFSPDKPPAVVGDGFALSTPCALPLDPASACEMHVDFAPQTEGALEGSLEVETPEGDVLVVALRGRGDPAQVVVEPEALAFGALPVGTSARQSITVESRAEVVIDATLAMTGDGGFSVGGATRVPVHLAPGATQTFDVDFAPSRGGPFAGAAVVEVCGDGCGPSTALTGVGVAPRIDVQPRAAALGTVAIGDTAEADLVVTNIGAGDLVLTGVEILADTDDVTLDHVDVPAVLAGGAELTVRVVYRPTAARAALDATLRLRSNDPLSPEVFIPVDAATPGPALELLPRVANFGVLDEGDERPLDVVLRSRGTVPAVVESIAVTGGAFTLEGAPAPGPLGAGEAVVFRVVARAGASQVDAGGASGELRVRATGIDDAVLPLSFLSGTNGCQPRAPAPNLALGSVVVGQGTSGAIELVNVGDGPCTIDAVTPAAGLAFDDGFTFSTARARSMAPGGSAFVDVAFSADLAGQRSAFFAVKIAGIASPLLVSATARGVTGVLVGEPPLIEIGPVVDGCAGRPRSAAFVNRGGSDVGVVDISLDPPQSPFVITLPPVPVSVRPGGVITAGVAPQIAPIGVHEATLVARTDDDVEATVRLRLIVEPQGTPVTETFEVPQETAVDVLFVVDNSGSMADDQQLLADNFGLFIAEAAAAQDAHFHIGVTTTDVIGGTGGPLVNGFLTQSTFNLDDRFAEQALVGVEGSPIELGLEAMRLAIDDFARSTNAGFLRSDAALSVVIVSDEDDNGGDPAVEQFAPGALRPVDIYVEALRALKGGNIANTPVLVSVVVNPGLSPRYEALSAAFQGVVLDIASPTWGEQLSDVGAATFGLQRVFRLGNQPLPGTVSVTVDGQATTAFTVDEAAATVRLDDAPPAGAVVEVTYTPGCQ
jgi:hypothetical protein